MVKIMSKMVKNIVTGTISEYRYDNRLKKYIVGEAHFSKVDFEAEFEKIKLDSITPDTGVQTTVPLAVTVDLDASNATPATRTDVMTFVDDTLNQLSDDCTGLTHKMTVKGATIQFPDKSTVEMFPRKTGVRFHISKAQLDTISDMVSNITDIGRASNSNKCKAAHVSSTAFLDVVTALYDKAVINAEKIAKEKAEKEAEKKSKKSEKTEKTDSDTTTSDTDVQTAIKRLS
jgi:hypothetical protein